MLVPYGQTSEDSKTTCALVKITIFRVSLPITTRISSPAFLVGVGCRGGKA
jgi:hypothetical protein